MPAMGRRIHFASIVPPPDQRECKEVLWFAAFIVHGCQHHVVGGAWGK